eukprot:553245-Hanusia_phi.AAC.2
MLKRFMVDAGAWHGRLKYGGGPVYSPTTGAASTCPRLGSWIPRKSQAMSSVSSMYDSWAGPGWSSAR